MRFKAEPKDGVIFLIYLAFLMFFIALIVINLGNIGNGNTLTFNPIGAFSSDRIGTTLLLFGLAFLASIASVSSYFFERESGFGFHTERKSSGYSKWAKKSEIMKITKQVGLTDKTSQYAGVPLLYDKNYAYVDDSEDHTLILGKTGSGKTHGIVLPTVKY